MPNWIQNHILLELTRHATRRFSQLRPDGVESNLFMYHLKGLASDGLIEKAEPGGAYRLSPHGLQVVSTLSLHTGKPRQQPQILTAVVCQNAAGEYLMVRWHRQPNIDQVSFPHGMVHFGERIVDMAALELAEKAGLQAELTYRGDVYIRGQRADDSMDRHMLVHVFGAANARPGRQDELRPDVSEPFWARLADLAPVDFVPGFYELAQLVDRGLATPFFQELTVPI